MSNNDKENTNGDISFLAETMAEGTTGTKHVFEYI